MSVNNYLTYGGPALAPTRNPFNYAKFEQINRDNVTPWLTLEEITQQLNLFNDESQDTYLSGLEVATRQAIEDLIGLPIMPVSYRVYYNANSLYGVPLSLDLPEVSQGSTSGSYCYNGNNGVVIDRIGYWNDDSPSVFITLNATQYLYDNSGNKVILADLPSDLNNFMTSPVVCEYTVQPSPLAAYPVIKQAGLLLLTHLYNNRSNSTEGSLRDIPFGVNALLRPYKPLVM
jgi:hypothetical protein